MIVGYWNTFLVHFTFNPCVPNWHAIKKEWQEDVCFNEIELCAQTINTNLSSIVNTLARVTYVIT